MKKRDGSDGTGADYIDQLVEHLQGRGVEVLTDHRVVNLIRNARNEIVGVEVETDEGRIAVRSRKAVIFGTRRLCAQPGLRAPSSADLSLRLVRSADGDR